LFISEVAYPAEGRLLLAPAALGYSSRLRRSEALDPSITPRA